MARFAPRSTAAPTRKREAAGLSTPARARDRASLEARLLHLQRTVGNRATNQLLGQLEVQRLKAPKDPVKAALDKATADAKAAADRATLKKYVEEGARQRKDTRLANSCEWVLSGRAKLFALVPTGDSPKRVKEEGKNPAKYFAFFPVGLPRDPAGDIMSPAVSYNADDLHDDTHIEFDTKTTDGWNQLHHVAVTNAGSRTKEYVWETLRHEVQHDADRSDDKKATAEASGNDHKYKLERYKTEYRAYNYEGGTYDAFSHAKKVNQEGFEWTEKQWEIFKGIRASYAHTEEGWNDNADVGGGRTFRQAVVAYVNPDSEGFNKYNSVRVDEFYNKLKATNNTMRLNAAEVKALITALSALKPEDAKYILNESADMKKLMEANLASLVRLNLNQLLQQRAST